MSGWATEVDPSVLKEAGAQAVLAKPFAMQQVTELLTQIAQNHRSDSREG
jgi:hypothetical protein